MPTFLCEDSNLIIVNILNKSSSSHINLILIIPLLSYFIKLLFKLLLFRFLNFKPFKILFTLLNSCYSISLKFSSCFLFFLILKYRLYSEFFIKKCKTHLLFEFIKFLHLNWCLFVLFYHVPSLFCLTNLEFYTICDFVNFLPIFIKFRWFWKLLLINSNEVCYFIKDSLIESYS